MVRMRSAGSSLTAAPPGENPGEEPKVADQQIARRVILLPCHQTTVKAPDGRKVLKTVPSTLGVDIDLPRHVNGDGIEEAVFEVNYKDVAKVRVKGPAARVEELYRASQEYFAKAWSRSREDDD